MQTILALFFSSVLAGGSSSPAYTTSGINTVYSKPLTTCKTKSLTLASAGNAIVAPGPINCACGWFESPQIGTGCSVASSDNALTDYVGASCFNYCYNNCFKNAHCAVNGDMIATVTEWSCYCGN